MQDRSKFMPQIILEYSNNLIEKNELLPLLSKVHEILVDSLPAKLMSCKSRAVSRDIFLIADGNPQAAFINLQVGVLSGRTMETLETTGKLLVNLMNEYFSKSSESLKLTMAVEIYELGKVYHSWYSS
jgi:5-carboxymethyl-2-hydroxymuconate isomerase